LTKYCRLENGLVKSAAPMCGLYLRRLVRFNLSEVYDYYRERHNRNSLDGQGGNLPLSSV
jgi:hypothetical protein